MTRTWVRIVLAFATLTLSSSALAEDTNATSAEGPSSPQATAPSESEDGPNTVAENIATPSTEQLLRAALSAYERGDLREAKRLFERVHSVAPSARTLRSLGIVAYQEARYVVAVVFFEQSLVHQVKPLTPELEKGVRELLSHASSQIGRVFVRGAPDGVLLELDGAPSIEDAQGALLGAPGPHQLRAIAPGFLEKTVDFDLHAGETLEVTATLEPAISVPAPTASEDGATPPSRIDPKMLTTGVPARSKQTDGRRRLRALGYVSAGLSLAALGTALGATGTALYRISAVEEACRKQATGTCDADAVAEQEQKANLTTLSRLATATAISAGVLGASSVAIFLSTGGFTSQKSESKALTVGITGRF